MICLRCNGTGVVPSKTMLNTFVRCSCQEKMCLCSNCLEYSGTQDFCPECRKAGCLGTVCLCPEGKGANAFDDDDV